MAAKSNSAEQAGVQLRVAGRHAAQPEWLGGPKEPGEAALISRYGSNDAVSVADI